MKYKAWFRLESLFDQSRAQWARLKKFQTNINWNLSQRVAGLNPGGTQFLNKPLDSRLLQSLSTCWFKCWSQLDQKYKKTLFWDGCYQDSNLRFSIFLCRLNLSALPNLLGGFVKVGQPTKEVLIGSRHFRISNLKPSFLDWH